MREAQAETDDRKVVQQGLVYRGGGNFLWCAGFFAIGMALSVFSIYVEHEILWNPQKSSAGLPSILGIGAVGSAVVIAMIWRANLWRTLEVLPDGVANFSMQYLWGRVSCSWQAEELKEAVILVGEFEDWTRETMTHYGLMVRLFDGRALELIPCFSGPPHNVDFKEIASNIHKVFGIE